MTSPHRFFLGVPALLGVLVLAACQPATDDGSPSASAAASVAASASAAVEPSVAPSVSASEGAGGDGGEEVSVFDIEAGDCFSADEEQLESVIVVDCDEPHVYEAFHVFDHEAGPDVEYPGDEAILDYADTECQPPFEEFVDYDYQTSIWYITSVTPSSETWAEGDREIVCTLNQQDDTEQPIEVTGSAEGSAE